MRTSLNTWYSIVIHVVKIFDTEDWEIENNGLLFVSLVSPNEGEQAP